MAVDTKQKRFSAINVLEAWRGMAIVPTGTIGQAERQAAAFMYSGILANPPIKGTGINNQIQTLGVIHQGGIDMILNSSTGLV